MLLRSLFSNPILSEGGNVSSQSPGWQGAADQEAEEIDLKIHDRDFMVSQLRKLLIAQNSAFKEEHGRVIWEPSLLKSGKMFSGSSLQFFDITSVSTDDFLNKLKKTKVGDIDTQVDQEIGDEIKAWLSNTVGKTIGNGTLLGFNSSLSSLWLLQDPPVRVQIDYELGPYDPTTKSPTEWFAYSHSSHYDDMAAGIKGVFHKYINRALTSAHQSTKYIAKVLKKGIKISDVPETDSDYSFAVSSAQGGGLSAKYKPLLNPETSEPMVKNGIPVMQKVEPKDRDYIQSLDKQFEIMFGKKRSDSDRNLQGSFVGTIKLMNKFFSPEQNEAIARAFLEILFGKGAQMITKDDPDRDRDIKFAAIDAMLLGGGGDQPLTTVDNSTLRQDAVRMAVNYADAFNAKKSGKASTADTEVAEDAAAADAARPNYARQGIKHLYNRLPDGRVSTAEMKNAEFLELAKEIADNGGTLNDAAVNLKVDGAGIRFGRDAEGRPFFMTSKVTTPLYQSDVGYFTAFGRERGQDEQQLARTQNYDRALEVITTSKFIQTLPKDTIVQAEMLYNPMAEVSDQGLKFVNIAYDPKKLGKSMTLVPFMFKQYSTGEDLPNSEAIKKKLLAASDPSIKIISNNLKQKGINVGKIIEPVLGLDPKKKANTPTFDLAKQQLSAAIIDNPKLQGKDVLGDTYEGIVVNMPSGRLFKVTSQQMKEKMAAKNQQSAAQRQGPIKTAVVAIGSFVGHIGHEQLWEYTLKKAKELGGDPYLFIGHGVGADDPIPPSVKVETWHRMYPQYKNNISTVNVAGGSLVQKIKHELINPQPGKPPRYDNIVIMVGEDQAGMGIANALMKAVTKFSGYEHVKVSLEATPRGTGMSFTKLRNILKDPNATPEQQYAVWSQGFDEQKLGKDWILYLMDLARKGMGISQQANTPISEMRLFNALIRPTIITENADISGTHSAKKPGLGFQTYAMNHTAPTAAREEANKNKDKGSKKKQNQYLDPELERDIGYATQHYADYSDDRQMAFNKYVDRTIINAKRNDRAHDAQIQSLKATIDSLKSRLNDIESAAAATQPPTIQQPVAESMLPTSAFAGSDKNKLGPEAHLKGSMKRAARQGDLVGEMEEDWQKVNKGDKTDGMSRKAVNAYRRENPGSKLKTAVTKNPKKIKKGSSDDKRRKSFCARMSGMKKAHASAKTKRDPNSPINKALRRWNCESVEELRLVLNSLREEMESQNLSIGKCVPLSEDIEATMAELINKIITNEAISHNQRTR
jgi:hypothetical protein